MKRIFLYPQGLLDKPPASLPPIGNFESFGINDLQSFLVVDGFIPGPTEDWLLAAPYQGRKSVATWLEDAEIPRTRRRLYLGHGAKDVTDLYERRDVTAFLAEDRDRLLRVMGQVPRFAGQKPAASEAPEVAACVSLSA